MLTLRDSGFDAPARLLARYGLRLVRVDDGAAIPGSFWGEPEAGLIGSDVYARADTPVHSLLHEAAHLIVMPAERRATIHTNASDSTAEEDATCALQILMADALPGVGGDRLMQDMDAWGYSFRLGSTHAWFEGDAEDAFAFLVERGLIERGPASTSESQEPDCTPLRVYRLQTSSVPPHGSIEDDHLRAQ